MAFLEEVERKQAEISTWLEAGLQDTGRETGLSKMFMCCLYFDLLDLLMFSCVDDHKTSRILRRLNWHKYTYVNVHIECSCVFFQTDIMLV